MIYILHVDFELDVEDERAFLEEVDPDRADRYAGELDGWRKDAGLDPDVLGTNYDGDEPWPILEADRSFFDRLASYVADGGTVEIVTDDAQ